MDLPVILKDFFGFLDTILPKSKEHIQRQKQLDKLRGRFIFAVNGMIAEAKDPITRETLERIKYRASAAIVNTSDGYFLSSSESGVTLGQNIKKMEVNPKTGEIRVEGPDIIEIPKGLLFTSDNKIREEGIMTQVHEWCHGGIKDEFWTDIIAIRAGIRMKLPKEAILSHIVGRRAAVGVGGETALFRFAKRKLFIIEERIKQKHLTRLAELGLKPKERKVLPKKETAAKRVVPAAQRRRPVGRIIPFPVLRRLQPRQPQRQVPRNIVPFARRTPVQRRLRRPA